MIEQQDAWNKVTVLLSGIQYCPPRSLPNRNINVCSNGAVHQPYPNCEYR